MCSANEYISAWVVYRLLQKHGKRLCSVQGTVFGLIKWSLVQVQKFDDQAVSNIGFSWAVIGLLQEMMRYPQLC